MDHKRSSTRPRAQRSRSTTSLQRGSSQPTGEWKPNSSLSRIGSGGKRLRIPSGGARRYPTKSGKWLRLWLEPSILLGQASGTSGGEPLRLVFVKAPDIHRSNGRRCGRELLEVVR